MSDKDKKNALYLIGAVFIAVIIWLLMRRNVTASNIQKRNVDLPLVIPIGRHDSLPLAFPPIRSSDINITQKGADSCGCSSCLTNVQLTLTAMPKDFESLTVSPVRSRETVAGNAPTVIDRVVSTIYTWRNK